MGSMLIKGRDKRGKIIKAYYGPKGHVTGHSIGHPISIKSNSEGPDMQRVFLKAAESCRANRAAKPTMPKMPWEDKS